VSFSGTSVGLDVHALSVVAHAVDEETGRVERARLCPDHGEIPDWLHRLRAPVRVDGVRSGAGVGCCRDRLRGRCAVEVDPSGGIGSRPMPAMPRI
jgi:transposase